MRSAFRKVEADTGVIALTSQWRIPIDCFPAYRQPLFLPIWPIQSLDLIGYRSDGVFVAIATGSPGSTLILDGDSRPPRLALEELDDDWPSDLREFQPGIIEVTAGYTDPAYYPDELKHAAKILIANSALYRESAVSGPGVAATNVPGADYDFWISKWVLPVA
jgi:uncharacterized phiE125 gp8 family phage protein